MQPHLVDDPRPAAPGGAVLAVLTTGQERLRSALRRVVDEPALVAALARVVVVDAGRTPAATGKREAVRLPAGLLRVVRQPEATRPEALARAFAEAMDEQDATAVLVLDDVALGDPAVLLEALAVARASAASDVVGLRDPRATAAGPESWWGAVLPLDAVRALGATLPEAGDVALAELVLRAEAVGFRPVVLAATGPVPVVLETDRLLLALLHAPAASRTRLLLAGAADDARLLRSLRFAALARRRRALAAMLGARSVAPRLRLWTAWSALQRAARAGAVERASAGAWTFRLLAAEVDGEWPTIERPVTAERPSGLRSPAWLTTKRRTTAA